MNLFFNNLSAQFHVAFLCKSRALWKCGQETQPLQITKNCACILEINLIYHIHFVYQLNRHLLKAVLSTLLPQVILYFSILLFVTHIRI